jgi:hypothetical protein
MMKGRRCSPNNSRLRGRRHVRNAAGLEVGLDPPLWRFRAPWDSTRGRWRRSSKLYSDFRSGRCDIPLRDCAVCTIELNDGGLDLLLSADDTYLPLGSTWIWRKPEQPPGAI